MHFLKSPFVLVLDEEQVAPTKDSALQLAAALAPPAQPFRLDPIHLRILAVLERDARISVAQLAREVGLTDNAVRYRVRKMRDLGIVRRFTCDVDPARFGRGHAVVLLLRVHDDSVLAALARRPGVASVMPTRGTYQAVVTLAARDAHEVEGMVRHLRALSGVDDVVQLETDPGAFPVPPAACLRG